MNMPVLSVAESPAAYLRRPPLVVDSSVLVAVLFEEAASDAALALLRGRALVAPWLLDFEIASVAQKKRRREGRSLAEVDAVLGTFMELPIQRMAISPRASLALAERYGLTVLSPQGVSTAAEATAQQVAQLIRQVRDRQVRAIFVENVTNPRLIEQIASETGAVVGGRLYSDALSGPAGAAPTYLALMRHNITTIADAIVR